MFLIYFLCNIGAFGNVKYCWLAKKPDAKFAIKSMKKLEIIQSKHVDHIENERKILELMSHPFIVSSPFPSHSLKVGISWLHARRQVHLLHN